MIKVLFHIVIVVFLTALTQVGGVAWAAALLIRRKLGSGRAALTGLFVAVYAALSVAVVFIAPMFGRVALPCVASQGAVLAMQSPLYCVLNRHYVRPRVKAVAEEMAGAVDRAYPGTLTQVLDANFPFFNGFPLLPHLSHHDGKKLDIALYYGEPGTGAYVRGKARSPIGYWGFEQPGPGAQLPCAGRDDWLTGRWNMGWFQAFNASVDLEQGRTRLALDWLSARDRGQKAGVTKVFIEPHLAVSLGVASETLRFQGCRAARHDDHIHFQVK